MTVIGNLPLYPYFYCKNENDFKMTLNGTLYVAYSRLCKNSSNWLFWVKIIDKLEKIKLQGLSVLIALSGRVKCVDDYSVESVY